MKRGMAGGAHRGPVGHARQRRTIRLVQILLVLAAAGLLIFAGFSLGRADGLRAARGADALDPPNDPSLAQFWVPALLGAGLMVATIALQGRGGVRLLTPQRLRELDEEGPVALGPAPHGEKPGLAGPDE